MKSVAAKLVPSNPPPTNAVLSQSTSVNVPVSVLPKKSKQKTDPLPLRNSLAPPVIRRRSAVLAAPNSNFQFAVPSLNRLPFQVTSFATVSVPLLFPGAKIPLIVVMPAISPDPPRVAPAETKRLPEPVPEPLVLLTSSVPVLTVVPPV